MLPLMQIKGYVFSNMFHSYLLVTEKCLFWAVSTIAQHSDAYSDSLSFICVILLQKEEKNMENNDSGFFFFYFILFRAQTVSLLVCFCCMNLL